MELGKMKIRAGGRLTFTVERADDTAVSATFIAKNDDNEFSDTVDYVDGVATFEFGSPDTDSIGTYQYQVNENFTDGSPDIYPNGDDCDGDCDLPELEICESLDIGS